MEEPVSEPEVGVTSHLTLRKKMKILHVDDDLGFLRVAKRLLQFQGGFEVETACSVEEAVEKMKEECYDAIVSDYEMPGKDGLQFLKELRNGGNTIPFIMFTGKGREEVVIEALNLRADYYLNKNLDPETVCPELANGIRTVVEKRRAECHVGYDSWLLQNISDAVVAIDGNFNITSWNRAAEKLYEWKAEEVIGRSIVDGLNLEHANVADFQAGIQTIKEKGILHEEVVYVDKTGKHFNVELNVLPLRDADGQVRGYVSVNRDVTERHGIVEELKQSESKYRTLAENLPAIVYRVFLGEHKRMQFFNDMVQSMTGYTSDELLQGDVCSIDPLIIPEDRRRVIDEVNNAVQNNEPFHLEYRVKHRDGSIRYFQEWGRPVSDVGGKPIHVDGVIFDTTEHRKIVAELAESDGKYRGLVKNAAVPIATIDLKGRFTYVNEALAESLGYSVQELMGRPFKDFLHPDDRGRIMRQFLRIVLLRRQPRFLEFRTSHKDGHVTHLMSKPTRLVASGKTIGFQAIMVDISELKRIGEELRRFSTAVKASIDGVVTTDLSGIIIDANDAALRAYGTNKKNDLIGKSCLDLVDPKERETVLKKIEEAVKKGYTRRHEYDIITKSGGRVPVELSSAIMKDEEGRPIGLVSIIRDMTERREAEKAVRESEAKYRMLVEQSSQGIVIAQGVPPHLVFANPAMVKVSGYTSEELASTSMERLIHPDDRARFFSCLRERFEGKPTSSPNEYRAIRKDGKTVWIAVSASRIEYNGQLAVQAVFVDITERKKADQAIIESQQKFERLFVNNPEPAVCLDSDFHIVDINPRFTALFGYSLDETKGKNINDVTVPKDRFEEAELLDKKAKEAIVYHDTVRKARDGSLIPVSLSAAPIVVDNQLLGYVAVYKDISELKKTEKELKQTMRKLETMNEKLLVVGDLTRHDARNRLTAIIGNAYLAKKKLSENSGVSGYLEEIEASARQTTAIFDFAKNYELLGVEELAYIDVGKEIDHAISLFPKVKDVKIINQCQGVTVLADSLLRELFYNLIDNSLKYGEKLSQIRMRCEETSQSQLKLVYEDDGVGVPLSEKPKLFGKDYTTGKGSGHGLYLIKKLVEVYGWTIREMGEPGRGALFVIVMPKTSKSGRINYQHQ